MNTALTARPKMRSFPGLPDQIRNVRSFVGRVLDGCPVADDVVLLAGELATNAVVHTASGRNGTFAVVVRPADRLVRVEVHDGGADTTPGVRPADGPAESGVGLGLVEALAVRWGYRGEPRGRVVWFEMEWQ